MSVVYQVELDSVPSEAFFKMRFKILFFFVVVYANTRVNDCHWAAKTADKCPDDIDGAVFWDEAFGEEENEIIIKNQAVVIRQNVSVNRIRVDECGYLTIQG